MFSVDLTQRLDLIVKYLFIKNRLENLKNERIDQLYARHILLRTGAVEGKKKSVLDFENSFLNLVNSIKKNGYKSRFPIVLSQSNGLPLTGAHRYAACLYLGEKPEYKYSRHPGKVWDINWFTEKRFRSVDIDLVYLELFKIENISGLRAVIIWPALLPEKEKILEGIQRSFKYLYSKTVDLSSRGLKAFVEDVYSLNGRLNVSQTIRKKAESISSNSDHKSVCIIFFKIDKGNRKLIEIKKKMRVDYSFRGPEFELIHTTDSGAESLKLAEMCLSQNNLSMLEFRASSYRKNFLKQLQGLKAFCEKSNFETSDFCVVGGSLLEVMGLRNSDDVDVVAHSRVRGKMAGYRGVKLADKLDLVREGYHNKIDIKSKNDRIMDNALVDSSAHHFYFNGVKFCNLNYVLDRKSFQRRKKDIKDVSLINKFLFENSINFRDQKIGWKIDDWFFVSKEVSLIKFKNSKPYSAIQYFKRKFKKPKRKLKEFF